MLRLLPKDVVNYIYELVHKNNTQDIINEYRQNIRISLFSNYDKNEDNCIIRYSNRGNPITYNDRLLRGMTYHKVIYNLNGRVCATLPERYMYSLTQEEFKLTSTPTK